MNHIPVNVMAGGMPYKPAPVAKKLTETKAKPEEAPAPRTALQTGKAKVTKIVKMAKIANQFRRLSLRKADGMKLIHAGDAARAKPIKIKEEKKTDFSALQNVTGNNLQAKIVAGVMSAQKEKRLKEQAANPTHQGIIQRRVRTDN